MKEHLAIKVNTPTHTTISINLKSTMLKEILLSFMIGKFKLGYKRIRTVTVPERWVGVDQAGEVELSG